jgi:flagellin-like hook-associated protein FlgL
MIVNKSMFPLQTSFSVLSKMQGRMGELQMQLGTGLKSSTLSGMGRDLPLSLSVRSRLARIEGFNANISTVNLRLDFLDNAMTRFDKIEGEARNSAIPGQYGTGDINMATLPGLSRGRFDELVTLLNGDVAGRYLFGGSVTDKPPLPNEKVLLEGEGGRAGFRTVVGERKLADAGVGGLGRLATSRAGTTVTLSEDGSHPFGFKLSNLSSSSGGVTLTSPSGDPASLGVDFTGQPIAGETVTMGFTLPDGTETQITLTATTDDPPAAGQFTIGADPAATAESFETALRGRLETEASTTLSAASTFAASQNFFNGPGEPALRVDFTPPATAATATALRIASPTDTVTWYSGESPAVSASNLGRLEVGQTGDTVTLGERAPVSTAHGFQITGVSLPTANISTNQAGSDPESVSIQFNAPPTAGETVTVTLSEPNGTSRTVTLTAVDGKAGPGQFSIGGDAAQTAANFSKALTDGVTVAAGAAEGNPRQSVTAQVDDATKAAYGVQANESGFLRMMRTMAAMSIETYPSDDPSSRGRFDAMTARQMSEMGEQHNTERGSIEVVTMELAVARTTSDNSATRHTNYKAQLDDLLSDVETVSKEDVAMEILALQVRLQASYQTTAMVAQLSLVHYIR